MPLKEKYKKILILGSGPIVIGQACEFDYSGTQACKALRALGIHVVLINSNPATIMTDPDIANTVYIEPLTSEIVDKILARERPDAIIPTLGGQTALNLGLELVTKGILKKHNVEMIGADEKVIRAAEDREEFRKILDRVHAKYPKSEMVRNLKHGMDVAQKIGFPIILRPNYTLGGGGGGVAYSKEEYEQMLAHALSESPTSEVLVEESILGWKEFELEVMRDSAGTFVTVCSIENLDPCGVHTGDSITIAPQQTLSERAYQDMRDEARKILDAVGLECGGANIQFAVHPDSGKRVVIEMNPRVSRSSALASKATGFPIAKIAAMLAVGFRLEEVTNDITKVTPSCYEPALDYVVTKIPRFAFEKFPGSKDLLTTQMKSVGEVMSIGRTFKESFQKAINSSESACGLEEVTFAMEKLTYPNSQRLFHLAQAMRDGKTIEEIYQLTQINPWFLHQIKDIVDAEENLQKSSGIANADQLLSLKRLGFSDKRLAHITKTSEHFIREKRHQWGVHPRYLQVDTCAGEFASSTPYFYSTYWSTASQEKFGIQDGSVMVLGSGPNRIGQGIEFDYCCVRGVKALQKQSYKVAMVNSNPETVSTDYDTSDYLFFEPLTSEYVLEIADFLKPKGVIVQLGGQTPINIAKDLSEGGLQLMGSSLNAIDLAEDRARFKEVCEALHIKVPKAGVASNITQALKIAQSVGYPLICRPSYVLGGRRMEVIETDADLHSYFERHAVVISLESPCFMDQFLEGALELDVDIVRGKDWCAIGGVIEHIEAAGVHSGDSMGVIPPQRIKNDILKQIETLCEKLAHKMEIIGHLNVQVAVKSDEIYVIEANPRCSRTVPFLAKAAKVPIVDLGVLAVIGKTAVETQPEKYSYKQLKEVCVKGVVFPFNKFTEADSILGPEMKSTGESMGRSKDYSEALLKAFISSHHRLAKQGEIFLSLREKDKDALLETIKRLSQLGYSFSATQGTAKFLYDHGIDCIPVKKVHEGRPHCVDRIRSGKVATVINTTSGRQSIDASFSIRRSCIDYRIPCITEDHAAEALLLALTKLHAGEFDVAPL
ncbi:MAG: carbamoyl-phosphate synthase large subunit [Bdellovibrionaceae bacterium]|nr:carbamoyl-phosphate synthase large subunit [Pseudobdellovibrionaceae bacterium]